MIELRKMWCSPECLAYINNVYLHELSVTKSTVSIIVKYLESQIHKSHIKGSSRANTHSTLELVRSNRLLGNLTELEGTNLEVTKLEVERYQIRGVLNKRGSKFEGH